MQKPQTYKCQSKNGGRAIHYFAPSAHVACSLYLDETRCRNEDVIVESQRDGESQVFTNYGVPGAEHELWTPDKAAQQALGGLDKSGLHPAKLTLREKTLKAPASKYWDGTFGDAFQWFLWGVCIPVAGLIGGLLNSEKVHPVVGMVVAAGIGLVMITIRLRTGKWPEGGESSG